VLLHTDIDDSEIPKFKEKRFSPSEITTFISLCIIIKFVLKNDNIAKILPCDKTMSFVWNN
jgi:hypothetical protein